MQRGCRAQCGDLCSPLIGSSRRRFELSLSMWRARSRAEAARSARPRHGDKVRSVRATARVAPMRSPPTPVFRFDSRPWHCAGRIADALRRSGSPGQDRTDLIARMADRTARIGSLGSGRSDRVAWIRQIGSLGSGPSARVAWIRPPGSGCTDRIPHGSGQAIASDRTDRTERIGTVGSRIRSHGL